MSRYLDTIVADVRRRLDDRRRRTPLEALLEEARPARASFMDAMRAPGISLIAEVKRASPSRGPLRPDLDVSAIVSAYEASGARAVSVLTEQDHFGGGPEDLRRALDSTELPILQKDFIVDRYQIYEARAMGASAVLLIAALLEGGSLEDLAAAARDVGLDVLVEIHDEDELARALAVPQPAVVGVNNRDLRSFEVSLETTFRLVSGMPPDATVVSESGIRGRDDVRRLEAAGLDGILVGEHLVTKDDVAAATRDLLTDSTDRKAPQ